MANRNFARSAFAAASLAALTTAVAAQTAVRSPAPAGNSIFQTCVNSSPDMPGFRMCLGKKGYSPADIADIEKRMIAGAAAMDRQQKATNECSAIGDRARAESKQGHSAEAVISYEKQSDCWKELGIPLNSEAARKTGKAIQDVQEAHDIIHRAAPKVPSAPLDIRPRQYRY